MRINDLSANSFGRKLTPNEKLLYTKTITEGLNVLDKKLGMIAHNSTVPAIEKENVGIGSLLSKTAEKYFIPFLKTHSFTSIQQDPINLRFYGGDSPYSPMAISKNINMIPLERLASFEYGNILSKETLERIVNSQKHVKTNDVNYTNVSKDFDLALWEAYNTLKNQLKYPKTENLYKSSELMRLFGNYKKENRAELEPQAIYEILAKSYNNNDWKNWSNIDQNLYNDNSNIEVKNRLKELKETNKVEIDFFMFKQWLLDTEISKMNSRNKAMDMSVIGDSPIAFSPVEEWQHQDLFMKNAYLGCPPDYFSKDGQKWGFAVLKPETIFNPDGSLGKGGELMKKRYENLFKHSSGGSRIDHIIGLIDPFIYTSKIDKLTPKNSGRLYSSPKGHMFEQYRKRKTSEYSNILEKIVIPAAEKYGLKKSEIIAEDLGTVTKPVQRVMKKLKLPGVAVTEFGYRGSEQAPNKIIMLGSHDNTSFLEFVDNFLTKTKKKDVNKRIKELAMDTISYDGNLKNYVKDLKTNKSSLITAMFAELFTSPAKQIQIMFTDFFGIFKTYNTPGKSGGSWRLRIPEFFENLYDQNLKLGTALNIPESIAIAIRHRGKEFASKHQELLKKLDEFAEILKS